MFKFLKNWWSNPDPLLGVLTREMLSHRFREGIRKAEFDSYYDGELIFLKGDMLKIVFRSFCNETSTFIIEWNNLTYKEKNIIRLPEDIFEHMTLPVTYHEDLSNYERNTI